MENKEKQDNLWYKFNSPKEYLTAIEYYPDSFFAGSNVKVITQATIDRMTQLATKGSLSPKISVLLGKLFKGVPYSKRTENIINRLEIVLDWIKENVVYVPDPLGVELIQDPEVFLFKTKIGDCDDYATSICAIAIRMGLKTAFNTIQMEGKKDFNHVFSEVLINGKWYGIDGIVKKSYVGWRPSMIFRIVKEKRWIINPERVLEKVVNSKGGKGMSENECSFGMTDNFGGLDLELTDDYYEMKSFDEYIRDYFPEQSVLYDESFSDYNGGCQCELGWSLKPSKIVRQVASSVSGGARKVASSVSEGAQKVVEVGKRMVTPPSKVRQWAKAKLKITSTTLQDLKKAMPVIKAVVPAVLTVFGVPPTATAGIFNAIDKGLSFVAKGQPVSQEVITELQKPEISTQISNMEATVLSQAQGTQEESAVKRILSGEMTVEEITSIKEDENQLIKGAKTVALYKLLANNQFEVEKEEVKQVSQVDSSKVPSKKDIPLLPPAKPSEASISTLKVSSTVPITTAGDSSNAGNVNKLSSLQISGVIIGSLILIGGGIILFIKREKK